MSLSWLVTQPQAKGNGLSCRSEGLSWRSMKATIKPQTASWYRPARWLIITHLPLICSALFILLFSPPPPPDLTSLSHLPFLCESDSLYVWEKKVYVAGFLLWELPRMTSKICWALLSPLSSPVSLHQNLTQRRRVGVVLRLCNTAAQRRGSTACCQPPYEEQSPVSPRVSLRMCRSFNWNSRFYQKRGKLLNPGGDRLVNVHFLLINSDTRFKSSTTSFTFPLAPVRQGSLGSHWGMCDPRWPLPSHWDKPTGSRA